jgi:hypothetical protein
LGIEKKIEINFQLNYYCIKQVKMSKNITEYGELVGYVITDIFGDEMSYNDLKPYAETRMTDVKVEVIRNAGRDTLVAIYFDDKKVFEKTYPQYCSTMMFYHLDQLEIEMGRDEENEDDEIDMCDNCKKIKKICGRMMSEEQVEMFNQGIVPDEHYGPRICFDCM